MSNESVIDFEKLKSGPQTGPLSEEAQEQIRLQAEKELAQEEAERNGQAPEEPKKEDAPQDKGKDEQPDPEKEAKEAEAKKAADEKAAAEQAEAQKKADELILAKKDEDLTQEEKSRKGELVKAEEEAFTEQVKQYAVTEKIPEDQARKQLESERSVIRKYEADPKKMAKTIVHLHKMHSQLEAKAKQEQERKALEIAENEVVIKGKKYAIEDAKDLMVEAYREKLGEKAVGMDDDKVFEAAKEEWKKMVKTHYEATKAKVAEAAKSKREEFLKAIPDTAKELKPFVEEVLKNAPDAQIIQDGFEIDDILVVARGNYFTDDKIKEIEKAAFARGQENSRILGEKNAGGGAGTGGAKSNSGKPDSPDEEVALLTKEQKAEALSKFDGITVWDENRKFKEYIDILKASGDWKPKKK